MFTIIGGDGKEYGPAAANQIREWIAGGRASLDTKAKAVGSDEWRRLGDYAEFAPYTNNPPALPAPGAPIPEPTPYGTVPAAYGSVPVVPQAAGAVLADRGERLLAQLLDNVIGLACALPGLILMAVAAARAGMTFGGDFSRIATAAGFVSGLMVALLALCALAIVQLWMLVTRGQTIGKRVLGIRIVSFEDEANPGFVKVFLLRGVVPAIIGAVPYLGVFFTLTDICFIFRDDRRCIHDIIADTKVIKG